MTNPLYRAADKMDPGEAAALVRAAAQMVMAWLDAT